MSYLIINENEGLVTIMDIKQQWQDALSEFGDRAFERFTDVTCNDDVVYYISVGDNVELKQLAELFEHGAKIYGFEAEKQMWEWNRPTFGWVSLPKQVGLGGVVMAIKKSFFEHRRKTSAALPFDLDRAKAGDVVEYCNEYGYWTTCTSKSFELGKHPLIILDHGSVAECNLRMKYPPKLKPSYDEQEFKEMVEKGTKAWADVPDANEWLEDIRGN